MCDWHRLPKSSHFRKWTKTGEQSRSYSRHQEPKCTSRIQRKLQPTCNLTKKVPMYAVTSKNIAEARQSTFHHCMSQITSGHYNLTFFLLGFGHASGHSLLFIPLSLIFVINGTGTSLPLYEFIYLFMYLLCGVFT